jgi:hypothetical protein
LKPSTKLAIRPVVETRSAKPSEITIADPPLAVALPEDIEHLVPAHHDEFHNADLPLTRALSPQAGRGAKIPLMFLYQAN